MRVLFARLAGFAGLPRIIPRIAGGGLAALASFVACNDHPDNTPLGSLAITTSAPATSFKTSDGWNVVVTKMLVHVTAVTVAGGDLVVAAQAGPQIVDQAAPGAKALLSAAVRTARPWEQVSLSIGPAAAGDIVLVPPASEPDRDQLQRDGLSLYVEGTLSLAGVTKTLKLGFKTNTLDRDCAGELNGASVRGLIVPPDGNDTADVAMNPAVLFADDLIASGAVPRGAALAGADADADGIVTTDELAAKPLDEVRTATGGTYAVGDQADVTDLGAFTAALSRKLVSSFRAKGGCLAEAQP